MLFALTPDDWTKIGVFVAIIGGVLIPFYLRWLDRQLRVDVRITATQKSGPFLPSRAGEKADPRMRLAIEATIINRGRTSVFLQSVSLKTRTSTHVLNFLRDEDKKTEFKPGDKWERPIEFGLNPAHRSMQERLLTAICADGAFVEVTTGDERTVERWAKEACDEHFPHWPAFLQSVYEMNGFGRPHSSGPNTGVDSSNPATA